MIDRNAMRMRRTAVIAFNVSALLFPLTGCGAGAPPTAPPATPADPPVVSPPPSSPPTSSPTGGDKAGAAFYVWKPGETPVRIGAPEHEAVIITPEAFNERGEVVGSTTDATGTRRAFFWSASRGFVRFTPEQLPGESVAYDINESGVVAGTIWLRGGESRAFIWSPTSGAQKLLSPAPRTMAIAINSHGHVAGSLDGQAFVWSPDGGLDLSGGGASTGGGYFRMAVDITDSRDLVISGTGRYERGVDYGWLEESLPFIWNDRGVTDLHCAECIVSAINNRQVVVGVRWPGVRAFKWTKQGGVEMLDSPNAPMSEAVALNESGLVAGSLLTWDGGTTSRAVVWLPSGEVRRIPQIPGVGVTAARDINEAGQVLVFAR